MPCMTALSAFTQSYFLPFLIMRDNKNNKKTCEQNFMKSRINLAALFLCFSLRNTWKFSD